MRDTADLVFLTGADDETAGGLPPQAPDRPDPVQSANIAPTDHVRVLLRDGERLVLRRHLWGLIPPWSKDARGAARMINARVESVTTKPAFREAIRSSRCLLPADAWYEWAIGPDGRQPHLVQREDGEPLWLAGIWARWRRPGSKGAVSSVSILTTAAPQQLAWLHDRAPVLVPDALAGRWLGTFEEDPQPLLDEVAAAGYPRFRWHAVSRELGQVRTKDARLMQPVEPSPQVTAITLF